MSETAFTIHQEQHGAIPLLRVRGEADLIAAPRFKEAIVAALHSEAHSLALDLSGVDFMDSAGLQVLISAKKRTAKRGGELYLLGVGAGVSRVFALVGFDRIFRFCGEADLPDS